MGKKASKKTPRDGAEEARRLMLGFVQDVDSDRRIAAKALNSGLEKRAEIHAMLALSSSIMAALAGLAWVRQSIIVKPD